MDVWDFKEVRKVGQGSHKLTGTVRLLPSGRYMFFSSDLVQNFKRYSSGKLEAVNIKFALDTGRLAILVDEAEEGKGFRAKVDPKTGSVNMVVPAALKKEGLPFGDYHAVPGYKNIFVFAG